MIQVFFHNLSFHHNVIILEPMGNLGFTSEKAGRIQKDKEDRRRRLRYWSILGDNVFKFTVPAMLAGSRKSATLLCDLNDIGRFLSYHMIPYPGDYHARSSTEINLSEKLILLWFHLFYSIFASSNLISCPALLGVLSLGMCVTWGQLPRAITEWVVNSTDHLVWWKLNRNYICIIIY